MIRIFDVILGLVMCILSIAAFAILACIVDSIELGSFIRGWITCSIMFGTGLVLYRLGTMED